MQEDFLHYIWKHKAFDTSELKTSKNKVVDILQLGQHNRNAGPDFFNAQLIIDGQLWAGNVEIHIKASDWYVHHHETDKAYDNVILHVVWEDDSEIFRNIGCTSICFLQPYSCLLLTFQPKPMHNNGVGEQTPRRYGCSGRSSSWSGSP